MTLIHGRIERVEFEQPLHQAIYEHILSRDGATPVAIAPPYTPGNRARRLA